MFTKCNQYFKKLLSFGILYPMCKIISRVKHVWKNFINFWNCFLYRKFYMSFIKAFSLIFSVIYLNNKTELLCVQFTPIDIEIINIHHQDAPPMQDASPRPAPPLKSSGLLHRSITYKRRFQCSSVQNN